MASTVDLDLVYWLMCLALQHIVMAIEYGAYVWCSYEEFSEPLIFVPYCIPTLTTHHFSSIVWFRARMWQLSKQTMDRPNAPLRFIYLLACMVAKYLSFYFYLMLPESQK